VQTSEDSTIAILDPSADTASAFGDEDDDTDPKNGE
jgi:hypothetical protein